MTQWQSTSITGQCADFATFFTQFFHGGNGNKSVIYNWPSLQNFAQLIGGYPLLQHARHISAHEICTHYVGLLHHQVTYCDDAVRREGTAHLLLDRLVMAFGAG